MNHLEKLKTISSIIQYPSSMCLVNSQETKEQKIAFCDRQMETIWKMEESNAFEPFVIEGLRATSDWWLNERIRIEKGLFIDDYFFGQLPTDKIPALDSYVGTCLSMENSERLEFCRARLEDILSAKRCAKLRSFWSAEIGALQYHIAKERNAGPSCFQNLEGFLDIFNKLLNSNSMEVLLALAVTCQVLADEEFLANISYCFVALLGAFVLKLVSDYYSGSDIMKFIYQDRSS